MPILDDSEQAFEVGLIDPFKTNITNDLECGSGNEVYLPKSKILMWAKETIIDTNMFDYYINTKH